MSDLERIIRAARTALPEPDDITTERARRAVRGSLAGRRRRRLAAAALAFAAALGGAFVLGLVLAPGGATKTAANGPGFLPAQGWETFQTGLVQEPMAPTATAATVPLGHDVLDETFPWQTVATLRSGEVLLEAVFGYTGDLQGVDAEFPPRPLPLSLDDARGPLTLEGQPSGISALRLEARVNNWNLDLLVFTRGKLTPKARAVAQRELNRLAVPKGPRGVLQRQPALRQSRGACTPSALRASVRLQGAAGSLLGSILVRNRSAHTCRLHGRPTVELRDANGALLPSKAQPAPPLWKQLGSPRPAGWPTVTLSPNAKAQVFVQLRNWCVVPVKPVFFRAFLPGVGGAIPAPVRVTLRCDDPQAPVSLSVGPVEPPTG